MDVRVYRDAALPLGAVAALRADIHAVLLCIVDRKPLSGRRWPVQEGNPCYGLVHCDRLSRRVP